MEELVAYLRRSISILIVTHNLALARSLANAVACLRNRNGMGYLGEHGSTEALFALPCSPINAADLCGRWG